MAIKYQNAKTKADEVAKALEDSLHYDEIAISRNSAEVTIQFYKDGRALFSEAVVLSSTDEVFRISGLKGQVKVKVIPN